ncbi:putative ABC transporter permease [Brotaphodocola sp.]|uniref:putative ABC transporter permease n=1 Tax=Brotaphodocola sp. TaxID=3073577 RepID=UPI003D7D4B32
MYTYAWYHWLTFFYVYCFFGWIFESTYVSLKQRHFVNRGFLRLPMLPLYGTGAVMMLWVSLPVRNSLIAVYFSGVIGATILEYITGWAMERLFKVRYWDYSNQKFNLHGYICLSSSIAWGFLTILMTEVIHPPIAKAVLDIKPHTEWFFLITTTILFGYDTFHSTKEALDLARALESITKLRAELEDMQVQIALLRAQTVQEIHRIKENVRDSVVESAELHHETISLKREEFEEKIQELSKQLNEKRSLLKTRIGKRTPEILRRNPGAISSRFASALKELRSTLENL